MSSFPRTGHRTALGSVTILFGLLLGLLVPSVTGDDKTGARTGARPTISPYEAKRLAALIDSTPANVPEGASVAVVGDGVYIPLQIEFESADVRRRFRPPEGVTVYHEFDRFADAFLDARSRTALADLQAARGLVWIDADIESVRVPPPPKVSESPERQRGLDQKIVRGGFGQYKGKGVVVAVIDDGVDFRHKDFITYDAEGKPTSRIIAYWDPHGRRTTADAPGKGGPVSYPNGAPVGVVYTRDDLTAELRNPTNRLPASGDHGTRCAGIAVGNGNGKADKRYIGVAPEADIIAVRIGGREAWHQFLLGAAAAWIDEQVGDRPCVVTCSFGHAQQGGRDGCRVAERQLDARYTLGRKGRAICIAAGNDAERLGYNDANYHAEVAFRGEENKGLLSWTSSAAYRVGIYIDTDDADDVQVLARGTPAPEVHRYRHPLSKSLVIEVNVASLTGSGKGQVELWSRSRKQLRADTYIDTDPSWNRGAFQGEAISRTGLLRTPGTMTNALTIGSYDWNAVDDNRLPAAPRVLNASDGKQMRLGDLSSYTSPGYSRTGQVKPIVVSPGQWYLAAAPGGPEAYDLMNGTSAATPYTAGVVALLFEKKPDLTLGQLHQLIRRHATTNDVTGRTPNPQWGYGRFDHKAVEAIFDAVR